MGFLVFFALEFLISLLGLSRLLIRSLMLLLLHWLLWALLLFVLIMFLVLFVSIHWLVHLLLLLRLCLFLSSHLIMCILIGTLRSLLSHNLSIYLGHWCSTSLLQFPLLQLGCLLFLSVLCLCLPFSSILDIYLMLLALVGHLLFRYLLFLFNHFGFLLGHLGFLLYFVSLLILLLVLLFVLVIM